MRKLPFLLLLLTLLVSCQEIPPVISPVQGGTGNSGTVKRRVLIEEFTGVRCVNCPAGTLDILNLRNIYKDQLISVGIHAGSFAPPYPDSRYDFRTPEGDGIINLLGRPLGYPSAVVNRKVFDGGSLQLGRSLWAGYINQELAIAPLVEVGINNTYNSATRQLGINVDVEVLQNLPAGKFRLSVMLVEDAIADVQLTPEGKKSDYVHRYNLRDMVTAFDGDPLDLSTSKKLRRTYTVTLPASWVVAQCSVVAFVHGSEDKLDVLQVNEAKIAN